MTLWAGGDPYTLQLPLMLDDYPERGSVERAMRVLNRLVKGDDDSPPGVVEIGGIPLPVDEWVIDGIDYGDPIRAVDDLRLLRQPVTLTLREYVPPEYVQLRRRSLVKPQAQDQGRHRQKGRHAGEDRAPRSSANGRRCASSTRRSSARPANRRSRKPTRPPSSRSA